MRVGHHQGHIWPSPTGWPTLLAQVDEKWSTDSRDGRRRAASEVEQSDSEWSYEYPTVCHPGNLRDRHLAARDILVSQWANDNRV